MALILASASSIRRSMLLAAGVEHDAVASDIDEAAVKARLSDPRRAATELAEAKASSVARRSAADWVIGSDSVASIGKRIFDKPANREQAAEHLRFFSGRAIQLTSAVALAQGSEIAWSHADTARLLVRRLSEQFISDYLDAEWPEVGYCVGVFRIEGRGVQLFDRIDGDYFTILGMPLVPLLHALRERRLIAA